ncbi:MAG TPA: type II CAAX endopeptidase family protein [Actinoplanes sp.]|nr:type II CAAX endopeptidase family protein [Actinoplanes sp.]
MTAPIPYHRLARTDRHRWWRPLAGSLVILFGLPLTLTGLFGAAHAVAGPIELRFDDSITGFAVTMVTLAMLTPLSMLAAWWVQRRPPGTLSSVAGRLRKNRLLGYLLLAASVVGLATGVQLWLSGESPELASTEIGFLVVLVLLVPLQAAGEEYLFRGWMLQAFGSWFRSPWPGIVVSSLLFGLAHGLGSPLAMADVTLFGVVTAVLTIRTGGLEAAIALHVANNLAGFALASEGEPDTTTYLISMVMVLVYAVAVLATPKNRDRISEVVDNLVDAF